MSSESSILPSSELMTQTLFPKSLNQEKALQIFFIYICSSDPLLSLDQIRKEAYSTLLSGVVEQ
jgi:hypothetical protein